MECGDEVTALDASGAGGMEPPPGLWAGPSGYGETLGYPGVPPASAGDEWMSGWVDGCRTIIHPSTHPIIPLCAGSWPPYA